MTTSNLSIAPSSSNDHIYINLRSIENDYEDSKVLIHFVLHYNRRVSIDNSIEFYNALVEQKLFNKKDIVIIYNITKTPDISLMTISKVQHSSMDNLPFNLKELSDYFPTLMGYMSQEDGTIGNLLTFVFKNKELISNYMKCDKKYKFNALEFTKLYCYMA
jgi:hypothetical protein